jgi:hypothetical protein
MKTIKKQFDTLNKAEKYQNRLYDRYSHVRLTSSPMFSESGLYVWEVKE